MNDLLTIAIPVYNRDTYFGEALASALNQTLPVPVMVVDNASTKVDFTALLAPYQCDRLAYFRNESNLGMVGNWNRCIDLCRTPYLLILHDDDLLDLSYAEAFHRHRTPDAGLFYGSVEYIDAEGRVTVRNPVGDLELFRDLEYWCTHNPAPVGAIFSTEGAKRLGGFNPKYHYTADFDFWFRLALTCSWRQIPAFAGWYRYYGTEEQATAAFARSGRIHGYRRNQWRRNQQLLRKTSGRTIPHLVQPGGQIRFAELVRMSRTLNDRWLRYATAICLRTPPVTRFGTMMRPFLRLLGPSLPRMVAKWGKTAVEAGPPAPAAIPENLRILVSKLDGIGDLALALPALRGLAEACPGVQIDLIVSSFNKGWQQVIPWIHTFYIIDFSIYRAHEPRRMSQAHLIRKLLSFAWKFRRRRYDAFFDLRTAVDDWHGKAMAWLSGAPFRLGGAGPAQWTLTHVSRESSVHQSDIILERLRVWNPSLQKARSQFVNISRTRPKSDLPLVILHPGVAGPERRWIMSHWIALARALAEVPEALAFQFLGGPEDEARLAEIAQAAGLDAGQTRLSATLGEMLQILADADLLVGLNSSAAHLAYLVGTPVITIFSAANNPASWAALGDNTVLFTPIECSPCHLPRCKWETHRCMEAISPGAVFSAIQEKLRRLGFLPHFHPSGS